MLTKYILHQVTWPLLIFTAVLSLMFWLAESLDILNLVINRQQSAPTFLLITLYVFPSLLTIIVPFALFFAVLFALHRLFTDSELTVMRAAGLSNWSVSAPVLGVAAGAAIVTLLLNLYVMPTGHRAMREKVYAVRADIASTMTREGSFTNPSRGLTVYNRTTGPDGELYNLLIHDNRERSRPTTYIAQAGQFLHTSGAPRLVMVNGNIQQISKDAALSTLYFDEYIFDLTEFADPQKNLDLKGTNGRYLHELFFPEKSDRITAQRLGALLAEGHNRLASPLYNIAFVLIALCAILLGGFSHRSNWGRLGIATAIGLPIRLLGFGLQSFASRIPQLIVYEYLLPLFVIFICSILLFWPQVHRSFLFGPQQVGMPKAGRASPE